MRKSKFATATAVLAAGFLLGGIQVAKANLLSVGYSLDGGATINLLASSLTGSVNVPDPTAVGGGFTVGVQASAFPHVGFVSPNFTSTTLDASAGGAGTLKIYVAQSLIPATGAFNASFSFASVTLSNATIEEQFNLGSNVTAFSTVGAPFADVLFLGTGSGTNLLSGIAAQLSDYTIVETYTINFSGAGNAGAGMTFTEVPEPVSLTLLGAGLVGLGLFGRRRRT